MLEGQIPIDVLTLLRIAGEGGGGRGEGGTKRRRYWFSPVTSTNVGISPQNFLTFSYNPFATLV